MKKFRADHYFLKIQELEIVKETENQIVFIDVLNRNLRESKISSSSSWHDDYSSAKKHLMHLQEIEIENRVRQIKHFREKKQKIELL